MPNVTVLQINRKQVDAPIILSRYVEVPACSDTFTKSNGVKVSRYKSGQLCNYHGPTFLNASYLFSRHEKNHYIVKELVK